MSSGRKAIIAEIKKIIENDISGNFPWDIPGYANPGIDTVRVLATTWPKS
jgi:hypothetical protein